MFKIKSRSIVFKILAMILVICILESLVFIIMSEKLTGHILEKMINENSEKNAELYSEFIGNWLTERIQEIRVYANSPIVKTMDWDQIEPYLREEVAGRLDIYDHFMVADPDGDYNTTLRRNVGNVSDREYFKAAMEGNANISNPITSRTNKKPITIVAAPIIGDNGEIIGVMAGSINLVKLSKIIHNLKYNYPDSYSYVVDKNGYIVAHLNEEFILQNVAYLGSGTADDYVAQMHSEILANEKGYNKYHSKNNTFMNYYHKIPNTDNWKLVINIPVNYWLTPIKYASTRLMLISLVGLITASALGFFFSKSISSPIIKLSKVFNRASAGDLTVRSEIDTEDEFGDASRSFNEMMDTITRLSYYDALTQLPNKVLFNKTLDMELEKACNENSRISIMILDIDKFKSINNTLGHKAGDRLLKSIAEKVSWFKDRNHLIFHIGEDRFAILFKDFHEKDEIIRLSDEIRNIIKQPWTVYENRFYITACIGIAFYPEDGENSESLFRNAYSAMQKAKGQGCDTYQLYDPSVNARLLEQMNLDSNMHYALDNGEFSLHYQPQIDARTKEIIGCEALIRWNHPELGIISPSKFIPVSEANGLIILIGRWVLYTACMQNKLWQDSGFKPIYVSVNLSAVQLIQNDFIDMVSGILKETGLAPEYLELEITESVAVKNYQYIATILERLKKMGIRIALDDFGTGYSSLNYLKNFAITTIKIDRSFIHDINENVKNSRIVSSILAMGHNLRLSVTAEGVETVEQYNILRDRGCDIVQGFYFSRPLPQNEFEKIIKKPGD
ncbi:MAG TPA: EAL domain-containing protein [Bacillota bacterium]|nr:EAL domain-containing protein [Bacillota bacterium]